MTNQTSNTPDSLDSGKLLMAYGKICEEKGFMSDHAVQVRMDIMTAILDLEADKAAAVQAARVDELKRLRKQDRYTNRDSYAQVRIHELENKDV